MLKLSDHLKTNDLLSVPYRGKVVNNIDPKKLGRIQVYIEGLLEGTPVDLPWVYQKSSSMLGGRTDLSSFAVPEKNSEVIVEFPYRDIYAGFYSGYWQSEATHQGYLDEDYPHSYGFRDIQNTFLKINKAKKFVEFQHASGARIFIDTDSTIEMVSDTQVVFRSKDNKTRFVFDMVTGDLNLSPKGNLIIGGPSTKFTSKEVQHDIGTMDEKVSGSKTSNVAGGYKQVVGGGYSKSILSSAAESIGGSFSKLTAGKVEEVIGQGRAVTIAVGGETKEIMVGSSETTMLLGDKVISIIAGNVDINTKAGSLDFENLAGKVTISPLGDIEVSNLLSSMKMDAMGNVTVENPTCTIDMSMTGDVEISNPMCDLSMGVSGDIQVSNPMASLEMSTAGEITMTNTIGGGVHVSASGQVAIGNAIAELLDLFNQFLTDYQSHIHGTGVGPSSPIVIPAAAIQIQTLLGMIKGSM